VGSSFPVGGEGSGRRFIVDDATFASNSGTLEAIGGSGGTPGMFNDNWIIVRNNGKFSFAAGQMAFGSTVPVSVPSGIEVDNATFTGNTLNLRNNTVLDIKGTNAAVTLTALTSSTISSGNEPTLKITVPAAGFATAPLKVTTVNGITSGMDLVIDAAAFSGGGKVSLISVAGDVTGQLTSSSFCGNPITLQNARHGMLKAEFDNGFTTLSLYYPPPTLILVR
jgi:hypothetical protein